MKKIALLWPADHSVISLKTPEIDLFFKDPAHMGPFPGNPPPWHKEDWSCIREVAFRWENPEKSPSLLQLSLTPSFRKCLEYKAVRSKKVGNLIPGSRYYWRVKGENGARSPVFTFTTLEDTPRLLTIPHVANVRDMGGWKTLDGKKIRYGMIFRGGQLEGWESAPKGLSRRGKEILLKELGLKMELDLRGIWKIRDDYPYILKRCVRHTNYPIYAYATWKNYDIGEKPLGIFSPNERERIRKIFTHLASPSFYPFYMHCQGGGDRTGTIAFLIGAALGMSKEDLLTEYELSNISSVQGRSRYTEVMVKFMEKWESYKEGGSIGEQVGLYLAECGITEKTLEKIRKILLTD